MATILNRIANGQGKEGDLKQLKYLGEMISKSSKCNLGQTGPSRYWMRWIILRTNSLGHPTAEKIPRQEYKVKVTAPAKVLVLPIFLLPAISS